MSFITHAQNFEDVLLWRALQHVTPGFYIDVGANDPVEHSVTKSFYDAGWRGINIEPLPAFHAAFMAQRPRDINLAVAAGAGEGEIVLYDVPAVNGWASSAPDVAAAHRAEGYELVELTVPLRTLNAIFAEHASADVHFLKIDVEGFEREVLLGLDLRRWRPWILVVEATMPNSRETNHETWEGLVTPYDYEFAYFDGLNRYYVAREHPELMAQLRVQANVFDGFISSHLANAWRDNADLRAQVEQLQADSEARQRAADEEHGALRAQLDQRITQLQASLDYAEDLRTRLEDADARAAELDLQMGAVSTRNDLLDVQLQAMTRGSDTLTAQLQAATARAADLEERLHAAVAWSNELEGQLHAANAWGNDLDGQLRAANAWGNDLAQQLQAVHHSTSWRISKPVRLAGTVYRRLAGSGPGLPEIAHADAVSVLKRTALQRLRTVATSPPVRKYVMPKLLRIPGVEQRLMRMAVSLRETAPAAAEQTPVPPEMAELSPRARQALSDLERARRRSSTP